MLPELLLAARPAASPALRRRVGAIGAAAPAPRRRLPRRRLALGAGLAVVLVAAAAGLTVGLTGRSSSQVHWGPTIVHGSAGSTLGPVTRALAPAVIATTPGRLQDYRARMELQVPTSAALSDRTKRAMRIARGLGGVVTKVDLGSHGQSGTALIVMRIPIGRIQVAIGELAALGRIVGQHVVITDAERRIETLRKLVEGSTGTARQIAQARLERELRKARLSTVAVGLRTPPSPVPAPPHRESTAARILEAEGRIALYAVLVTGPILLLAAAVWLVARGLRRRSDRRLLEA
jgi:hypothetical protein